MPRSWIVGLRRRAGEEAGFTLPELLSAMMILSIVLVVFLTTLVSVQRSAVRQDYLSRANDQARLAMEELDREIRSGNVLYDPTDESSYSALPVGYTLRIYTQTNATTRIPLAGNPGYVCSIWTINDEEQLLKNIWPPLKPAEAIGWRVVAEGVINRVASPVVPAFSIDDDPNKGGRTVDIRLVVNPNPESSFSRAVQVETSSTGRNTSYGFPEDLCSDTPT